MGERYRDRRRQRDMKIEMREIYGDTEWRQKERDRKRARARVREKERENKSNIK